MESKKSCENCGNPRKNECDNAMIGSGFCENAVGGWQPKKKEAPDKFCCWIHKSAYGNFCNARNKRGFYPFDYKLNRFVLNGKCPFCKKVLKNKMMVKMENKESYEEKKRFLDAFEKLVREHAIKEERDRIVKIIKSMHEYNTKSIAETDIPVIDKNLLLGEIVKQEADNGK